MNARLENSFRPNLETLEARQLLAANLGSSLPVLPPAVAPQQHQAQPLNHGLAVDYGTALTTSSPGASQVKGQLAAATEYSAVTIMNNTQFTLTFSIRWYDGSDLNGRGGHWTSWQTFTLKPGWRGEYYINRANPGCLVDTGETAQIYFATSTTSSQTRTYNLSSSVVNGTPAIGAGTHYQFLRTSSTTLDLYTGG